MIPALYNICTILTPQHNILVSICRHQRDDFFLNRIMCSSVFLNILIFHLICVHPVIHNMTCYTTLVLITLQTVVATHTITLRKSPPARNTGCAFTSIITGVARWGAFLLLTLLSNPGWDAGSACSIVLVTGDARGGAVLVTVVAPLVGRTGWNKSKLLDILSQFGDDFIVPLGQKLYITNSAVHIIISMIILNQFISKVYVCLLLN